MNTAEFIERLEETQERLEMEIYGIKDMLKELRKQLKKEVAEFKKSV